MSNPRYGEKGRNIILKWVYIVVFVLIATWLLSSILTRKSPGDVLRGVFSKMPVSSEMSCEELLVEKDSIIQSLQQRISSSGVTTSGTVRGIVLVDSQHLNMREGPSLHSDIILKIPANSEVIILYYDSETYYIAGQAGKWAKIKYAGTEGWVWGNYVKEI